MQALLLIDLQKGFLDVEHWGGARNNPDMEKNAARLLSHWRQMGWPVIFIRHDSQDQNSPFRVGQIGNEFMDGFAPQTGERVYGKTVNSAFIDTTLEADLRKNEINALVVAGISTEHCVSTTVRMAGNLGFDVTLVEDACFAWTHGGFDANIIHDTQIAVLKGEFAKIKATKDMIG